MLSKDHILRGLRRIDAAARHAGVVIDLPVYEGTAVAFVFDLDHATRDVDALVHGSLDVLRRAAADIAAEVG